MRHPSMALARAGEEAAPCGRASFEVNGFDHINTGAQLRRGRQGPSTPTEADSERRRRRGRPTSSPDRPISQVTHGSSPVGPIQRVLKRVSTAGGALRPYRPNKERPVRRAVCLALFFGLTIAAAPAQAATLNVSTSGSDSNACTSAAPCRNFQRAFNVAAAGDVVSVAAGNYGEQTITGSAKAVTFRGTGNVVTRQLSIQVSNTIWDNINVDAGGVKPTGSALYMSGSGMTFKNASVGNVVDEKGLLVTRRQSHDRQRALPRRGHELGGPVPGRAHGVRVRDRRARLHDPQLDVPRLLGDGSVLHVRDLVDARSRRPTGT